MAWCGMICFILLCICALVLLFMWRLVLTFVVAVAVAIVYLVLVGSICILFFFFFKLKQVKLLNLIFVFFPPTRGLIICPTNGLTSFDLISQSQPTNTWKENLLKKLKKLNSNSKTLLLLHFQHVLGKVEVVVRWGFSCIV